MRRPWHGFVHVTGTVSCSVEKVAWKERGTVCADTRRSVPTAAILALDLTRLAPD